MRIIKRIKIILLILLTPLTMMSQVLSPAADKNQATMSLERCLQLAEKNNPSLKEARLEIEKAGEVKKGTLTKYFPQVQAMGGGYYALQPLFVYGVDDIENHQIREALQTFFSNYGADLNLKSDIELFQKGYAIGATAVQPVFYGGQIFNGNRLAELGRQAQELHYKIAKREKLREVEEQYWLVMSLHEKQKTLTKAMELTDTTQSVLTAAIEAGMSLPADQLKLTSKREQLRIQRMRLEHGIDLATRALALSIGADSITMPDSLVMRVDDDITGPDYSAREEEQLLTLDVRAQELQKLMEVGKSLPKVTVGASYSYSDLTRNRHNGVFFATVQVPLTQWWESSHKIREKQLNIAQAELRQSDLTEKLRLQRLQQYYTLVEERESLKAGEALIAHAEEGYRIALLNYEAGLCSMSELLEAQTILIDEQTKQVDTYIRYRLALRECRR